MKWLWSELPLLQTGTIFNRFEILSVILIQIIRHLPPPELKVVLFVEFVIQTLASIHEVIKYTL